MRDQSCTSVLGRAMSKGVVKEIDHVLVSAFVTIPQSWKVFQSARFFPNDHWLVVTELKLHVNSVKHRSCHHTVSS